MKIATKTYFCMICFILYAKFMLWSCGTLYYAIEYNVQKASTEIINYINTQGSLPTNNSNPAFSINQNFDLNSLCIEDGVLYSQETGNIFWIIKPKDTRNPFESGLYKKANVEIYNILKKKN